MAGQSYDYLFKLVILGDPSVGKTSIINRYVDKTFTTSYVGSIGIDFKINQIELDNQIIKLQIWDTAGQERFRSITAAYYRGAHAIILVFDIHVRVSFERLVGWIENIKKYASEHVFVILVGNKHDLEEQRTVTSTEAKKFARKNDMEYFEVSAKTGEQITEIFDATARGARKSYALIQQGTVVLNPENNNQNGGWCFGSDSC